MISQNAIPSKQHLVGSLPLVGVLGDAGKSGEDDMGGKELVKIDDIRQLIYTFRGVQVMIDRDLSLLYGVETSVLNQAVKRNDERFPKEFCFQLSDTEFVNWKSQIVISNKNKMGIRRRPYAFTEQGVAMLSAVLRSETAERQITGTCCSPVRKSP